MVFALDDPDRMIEKERIEYGITKPLPRTLQEGLALLQEAIDQNSAFVTQLGEDFVRHHIKIKEAEQELLDKVTSERKQKIWIALNY